MSKIIVPERFSKVDAYKCNHCDYVTDDLPKAQKHASYPLFEFPKGFIFKLDHVDSSTFSYFISYENCGFTDHINLHDRTSEFFDLLFGSQTKLIPDKKPNLIFYFSPLTLIHGNSKDRWHFLSDDELSGICETNPGLEEYVLSITQSPLVNVAPGLELALAQ
jgi:hypothetical protein